MFARIGLMLNRHVERVLDPPRKNPIWLRQAKRT
jgi:hypothetical protein